MTIKEGNAEKAYEAMVNAGLLKSKQKLTNVELQSNIAKTLSASMSKEEANAKAKELMSSMGLSVAKEGENAQTVKLTKSKLSELVAEKQLTLEQAEEIAARTGVLVVTEAQNALAPQWIIKLKAMAIATWEQVKATAAWLATTPAGWITAAVAALGVGIIAYRNHQKSLEELRHATEEAANAYKESASSIDDYVLKYQELREALIKAKGNEEETYNIKKQLLELQTELNDKFGDEYGNLNLVTDAYKDQTQAIKNYNKEAAKKFLNENRDGIDNSYDEMTKKRNYYLSSGGMYTDEADALKEIAEKHGIDVNENLSDGTYYLSLRADAQDAYDTINAFMSDLQDKANEIGDKDLFSGILDVSSDELNRAKKIIDEHGSIFKQALIAEIVSDDSKALKYNKALNAVDSYNDAMLKSEDPYNDKNVENARRSLQAIQNEIANDSSWEKYSSIMNEVFDQADTRLLDFNKKFQTDNELKALSQNLEGMDKVDLESLNPGENESFDKLKEAAKEYELEVNDLVDTLIRLGYVQGEIKSETVDEIPVSLSISQTIDQLNTQLKPAMDSLKSAWNDIFTDDEMDLDSVDILSTCGTIKSQLNEMSKSGLNIDYSSYEDFVKVLRDSKSETQNVKTAFNNLASSITHAALSGAEDFETMTAVLEDLGINNADIVAFQELAQNTDALKEAGLELADASYEEIDAFAQKKLGAENAAQGIALLLYNQLMISQNPLSTLGSIESLSNLGGKAAETGEIIAELADIMIQMNTLQTEMNNSSGISKIGQIVLYKALEARANTLKKKVSEGLNTATDYDTNKVAGTKSASNTAKETQKEADIMSELKSEMDKLQSAYKSLCDIRDTYNEHGKITIDQYQELTDLGFGFLSTLVDENGQLGLNANAFEQLSNAKLQEMQIQLARNAVDTINGLKSEAEATEFLAYANEHLRDATLDAVEAQLYNAQAAATGKKREAADMIVQGYEATKQLVGKVEFGFDPSEMNKSAEDAKKSFMDAYNEEKKLLDHMKSMGEINNSEYYEKLMKLAEKYFSGNDEYRDNLWEVQEQYHDYLESIKKTYNWIENLLSSLSKKTNALISKAEKFISWQKKNAMINRAIKASNNEITQNRNAYQIYMAKANSVGLSKNYVNKIQNGSLTIEDLSNEKLSGKIEKYQEWYDKAQAVSDTINDLYDKQRDLIRQKLDNVLDYYSDLDSYLSSVTSKIESIISLNNEMGKRTSLTDIAHTIKDINHYDSGVKRYI